MHWLLQHQAAVVAAIAGLSTILATIRNVLVLFGVLSTAKATWLGNLADRLSWLAEHAKGGIGGTVFSAPLLDSKPAGTPFKSVALLVPLAFALSFSGCATSGMPANATLSQKFAADLSVVARMESDVKNQCGPQFAPLATTGYAIVTGIMDAVAENIPGAVQQAAILAPALASDVKGVQCVVTVLKADWAKYMPAKSSRLEAPAARAQLLALLDVPPVCDSGTDEGADACRTIAIDDDLPTDVPQQAEMPAGDVHAARASARLPLVAR